MRRCVDWYKLDGPIRVADLGAMDVNGSYRQLFGPSADYVGFDLESGPGVDIVLDDPYRLPLKDASVDLVISGQTLEHCAYFWQLFSEIARVMKDGGVAFVIAPSAGPIHRYPVDCYRFYPDSYQALAQWSGLRLVHCWMDERGPWRDLVGVFQKGHGLSRRTQPPTSSAVLLDGTPNPDPAAEVMSGQLGYLDALTAVHALLRPELYVEIGVRKGKSLALCKCERIGIDPKPELKEQLDKLSLYPCTSDDFFFFHVEGALTRKIDLAFIDGMHLVEYVLRDFMNLERHMSSGGVIMIDDVLPNHALQAQRDRQTRVWCGDVWRIVPLLRQLRPDLELTVLDTRPTGLLIVSKLDPASQILWHQYNQTVRQVLSDAQDPPPSILAREEAVAPSDENLRKALGLACA